MQKHYFLSYAGLQELVNILSSKGYACHGPQLRDDVIAYAPMKDIERLPWGVKDKQIPGEYTLSKGEQKQAFLWANATSSIKPFLFKAEETVWKVVRDKKGQLQFKSVVESIPTALIGVRPCDIAAMQVQDKVFLHGKFTDPRYQARRASLFTVVVNCNHPANSCFCIAAGYDPQADNGFDIALTELEQGFTLTYGSDNGHEINALLNLPLATTAQISQATERLMQSRKKLRRTMPSKEQLTQQPIRPKDHPAWDAAAKQCISCGSCTQMCPTCFCHREMEMPLFEEDGSEHLRSWDSCFSEDHGYTHGFQFRPDTKGRYQQWLNHKFVEWHQQFGCSGCVGCGRCMTWCPAHIDVTQVLGDLYAE